MNFTSRRRLQAEGLEIRTLLAGDVAAAVDEVAASPAIFGDANSDGLFGPSDLVEVFQAGKYDTGEKADWNEGEWNGDDLFDSADLILAFQSGNYLKDSAAAKGAGSSHVDNWPDAIDLPIGFEPEGIELGRGHDFFAGAFSFSSFLGPHPTSPYAGAIYKGDLHTGKGEILVEPTGRPIAGLSYDARTDNIYAAVGDPGVIGSPRTNLGVVIYNGTSGELVDEIIFGDGVGVNDLLVTRSAVYATDSTRPVIFKIPLEPGGRLPSTPAYEELELTGPGVGARNNGLVAPFDGNDLVLINDGSGLLYHVDTDTGAATAIDVEGEQTTFQSGDGLYLSGRTLYIMQNQVSSPGELGKIAVVQLSGNLSKGTFVKDIVSGDFKTPTTITGFGDSIYAINSNVLFNGSSEDVIFNPGTVTNQIVKVHK